MSGWLFFHPLEEVDTALDDSSGKVVIRIFGFLRDYMDERDMPYEMEKDIPPEGRIAHDIAKELQLPIDKVESVFRNGKVINIYDPVFPGDRVAFFPQGTPGPYRVFLGIARENAERARREAEAENLQSSVGSKQ